MGNDPKTAYKWVCMGKSKEFYPPPHHHQKIIIIIIDRLV